jgi:hypothetical protein
MRSVKSMKDIKNAVIWKKVKMSEHEVNEYGDNDEYERSEASDMHDGNSLFTIPENGIAT